MWPFTSLLKIEFQFVTGIRKTLNYASRQEEVAELQVRHGRTSAVEWIWEEAPQWRKGQGIHFYQLRICVASFCFPEISILHAERTIKCDKWDEKYLFCILKRINAKLRWRYSKPLFPSTAVFSCQALLLSVVQLRVGDFIPRFLSLLLFCHLLALFSFFFF